MSPKIVNPQSSPDHSSFGDVSHRVSFNLGDLESRCHRDQLLMEIGRRQTPTVSFLVSFGLLGKLQPHMFQRPGSAGFSIRDALLPLAGLCQCRPVMVLVFGPQIPLHTIHGAGDIL